MNQRVIIWGSFFFKMLTHYTKDWITLAARPDNLQQNLNCALLKWLDGVFQGQYLPSLPTSPLTKICKNYHHSCIRYRWKFVMIRVAILSSCHSNEMTPLLTALEAVFLGTAWEFFFSKIVHKIFFAPVAASMLAKFKLNLWERYGDILGWSCNWKNAFEIWRNVSYCCPQKYETRERYS